VARTQTALSKLGSRVSAKRKAHPEETAQVWRAMSKHVAVIDAEAPVADAAERLPSRTSGSWPSARPAIA
jgi:hypothetical protein